MQMDFKDCCVDIHEAKRCCDDDFFRTAQPLPLDENCGYTKDYVQTCAMIIESIAREQTAISYILKSESLKIEKAVELSVDVCDLMKLSEKSNSLISSVTALEQTLLMKLEMAKNLIEGEINNKHC
ncbi:MAG: hypothetical protein R3Y27_06030 [Clostridia bacterium]